MPWVFEFTQTFTSKAAALRHGYQKQQVREKIEFVKTLRDPRDDGGPYMGQWAYIFCGRSILRCIISEDTRTVRFTDIIE